MLDSHAGALKGAIEDILKFSKAPGRAAKARRAEQHCRVIAGRDYDLALRRHFDPAQLRQIFREVQRTLPTLNREIYRTTDRGRLAGVAEKLGVVLQDHALGGSEGAGFRGFYVNEAKVLKSPIIWVNTAAPAPAAAAAFWHEVGHHLTGRLWGIAQSVGSSFTGYPDDFSDPKEIVADMVRVLGGYPQVIARRLFDGSDMAAGRYDADMIIRKAMPHVRAMMGFDLRRNQFATQGNLLYLGGVIHTAKLRMTLLSQYGI